MAKETMGKYGRNNFTSDMDGDDIVIKANPAAVTVAA